MIDKRLVGTAVALAALALPSAASAADRDKDHMRDSWEKRYGLSTTHNDARRDPDRDRLRNVDEYRAGSNPRRRDSDGDGVRDNREGAGTIKSFDSATGVLVINVFASDTDLTGRVDGTTKIECEDEGRNATPSPGDTRGDGTPEDNKLARGGSDDDDGDRSGSNSGPGRGGDDRRSDDDDDNESVCTPAALDVGRTVKEAELHTGDDGDHGVFDEIEVIVR